jgi:hypothetical protein
MHRKVTCQGGVKVTLGFEAVVIELICYYPMTLGCDNHIIAATKTRGSLRFTAPYMTNDGLVMRRCAVDDKVPHELAEETLNLYRFDMDTVWLLVDAPQGTEAEVTVVCL